MQQNMTLDMIILHYILRDKKHMLELSKSIRTAYFDINYQDFFALLHAAFLDPNIKEVLSLPAFLTYCKDKNASARVDVYRGIYEQAMAFRMEGKEPAASDFGFYLQKLKERYNALMAEEMAIKMTDALNKNLEVNLLNKIATDFIKETSAIHRGKVFDEGSLGEDIVNIYNEYQAIKDAPEQFRGILTGIKTFDALTNGFFGGELVVVGGMEGSGKSTLVMNWGVGAWLGSNYDRWFSEDPAVIENICEDFATDGNNVVYFSLEMPRSNRGKFSSAAYLNKRLISCISGLEFSKIRKGDLSPEELLRFKTACKFVKKYDQHKKMYVVDIPRGATTEDIEVKLIEIQEKFPVHMIIIDYLGLMAGGEDDSDWEALGHIAEKLHELGRIYNIPVITPAQVNRPSGAGQSLNKQNYNTTRIGRSAMIGQNANIVLQIGCRDQEEQYTDMPLHIIKMRDGAKGLLNLSKDFSRMRVFDAVSSEDAMGAINELVDLGDDDED